MLGIGQAFSGGAAVKIKVQKQKGENITKQDIDTEQRKTGDSRRLGVQARLRMASDKRLGSIHRTERGAVSDMRSIAMERDRFMSAEDALAFGIVDKVVEQRPATPKTQG